MLKKKLIGPFRQLLTMDKLQIKGALPDDVLEIIEDAGIVIEGDFIERIDKFQVLFDEYQGIEIEKISGSYVALPGFIDPHTHICWAGNRAIDYAMRLAGKSYIEIAKAGGGIWDTVIKTRAASEQELSNITVYRANQLLKDGITTIEVKSGYGLTVDDELKMLRAISAADKITEADLFSTCLAAHICPKDFWGSSTDYLAMMAEQLLPKVKEEGLANRVDIFIEDSAFSPEEALDYLMEARKMGFEIVVHADQFTTGGSKIATEADAISADHLEASEENEIKLLASKNTIPVALPGASIGLADPFTPARRLLDAGASLAIGSDWNPGSAPMGDLLVQAAILSMQQKLNTAETLAAITCRAAAALDLKDRGVLKEGNLADIIAFRLEDYREILYNQGRVKPEMVIKKGIKISSRDKNIMT
ncbi:MAG TPA: imidazolonepropionase [Bacteroidales bacterium]|mgnify:CR=1 FL=1|jgi:imidazolonepropionase|nr:imidazolonepropionase [Bacteroidales bacterium]